MEKIKIILFLLMIFPIIAYFSLVFIYAKNIPYYDDYDVFLHYLRFSPSERVYYAFAQHNEHRLLFSRLIGEVMCQLFGTINFKHIVYIGNAALIFIFLIFVLLFKETGAKAALLLPIPYMLFLNRSWENMTWATGSTQNYYVLLFSLLSLLFFRKNNLRSVFISVAFASIASFTSGGGLIIFFVLISWSIIDLIKSRIENEDLAIKKQNIFRFIIACIASIIIFIAYFFDYSKPSHHPSIIQALLNPLQLIEYLLSFLGSYLKYPTPALIAGICSLIVFIYLTYKKHYLNRNNVGYYFLVFLLLNAMAASLTRSGFGVNQAIASRYTIISVLILISAYITLLNNNNFSKRVSAIFNAKRWYLIAPIILTAIFYLSINVYRLSKISEELTKSVEAWDSKKQGLVYPNQEQASMLIRHATHRGFYDIESLRSVK